MTRRMRLFVLVVAAFSLIASACFQIRGIKVVGDKVLTSVGQSTQVKIDLFRQSQINDSTNYVFLLIGLNDLDYGSTTQFDLKGNWGGPLATTLDNGLESFLLADDNCAALGVSATDINAASFDEWVAIRTQVKVNSSNNGFFKSMREKITVSRETGTNDNNYGQMVVFSGVTGVTSGWTSGLLGNTTCTSMFITGIPFK
jgi:hypothetical protein